MRHRIYLYPYRRTEAHLDSYLYQHGSYGHCNDPGTVLCVCELQTIRCDMESSAVRVHIQSPSATVD